MLRGSPRLSWAPSRDRSAVVDVGGSSGRDESEVGPVYSVVFWTPERQSRAAAGPREATRHMRKPAEAYMVSCQELEPNLELMNLETHSASLSVSLHTFVTPQQSNPTGSDRAAFVGTKTCAMAMLLW